MSNIQSSTDLSRFELYELLKQAELDFKEGRTLSFEESMQNIQEELKKYYGMK